jgi:hypothetical protein
MKKVSLFISFFSLFLGNSTIAQDYSSNYYTGTSAEAGISLGLMNCLTDLGGNKGIGKQNTKDLNIGKSASCVGAYLTCLYRNSLGIRAEAAFGNIMANDDVLNSVPLTDISSARYNRNLNFKSKITEFSIIAEIYPKNLLISQDSRESSLSILSPYLLGGIGYYSFNPQGDLNGRLIDLQPLRTEGQGFYDGKELYKLKQTNIPLGIGVKFEVSPIVKIRSEFVYRMLSTDYLDDVSTRYISTSIYGGGSDVVPFKQQALAYGFLDANGTTSKYDNVLAWYSQGSNFDPSDAEGKKRGDPTHNDSYFSFNIKVGIMLSSQRD